MIGTDFVFGAIGAHESFGFVELGVEGVFGVVGLVIDDERIKPVCNGDDDGFDSFAVNNIDCLKAGLTIS